MQEFYHTECSMGSTTNSLREVCEVFADCFITAVLLSSRIHDEKGRSNVKDSSSLWLSMSKKTNNCSSLEHFLVSYLTITLIYNVQFQLLVVGISSVKRYLYKVYNSCSVYIAIVFISAFNSINSKKTAASEMKR